MDQELVVLTDGVVVAEPDEDGRDLPFELTQAFVEKMRICATTPNTLTPVKWGQYVSPDLPYRPPCP